MIKMKRIANYCVEWYNLRMTFEENLAKLEGIVSEMEAGRLSLDDMMKNFEEGKKLVASCTHELESIRQRIEEVVSGNQEPPQVEPMDIV
jgi:exodeoxyribonuclease VII small subunit